MRYQFTDRVRKALAHARLEAASRHHRCITPAHILWALLQFPLPKPLSDEPSFDLDALLAHVGAELDSLGIAGRGTVTRLQYSPAGNLALETAAKESAARGSAGVTSEHLLIGVLRADETLARILRRSGIRRIDSVSDELAQTSGARRPAWFLQVNPEAAMPLYDQIIERVKEAIATGRLHAGERLLPVRQVAAQLQIAPGTVARAYSMLEALGIVITERGRGTRIAPLETRGADLPNRIDTLEGLLRPVVIAAFHLGAQLNDLKRALESATKGIYDKPENQAPA